MRRDPISRYMTREPVTIAPAESIATAYELMSRRTVRHLPVVDQGRLVGIVSQRDLFFLEALHAMDPETMKVREAMTLNPYTVPPSAAVHDVAAHMAEHKYGATIVVDGERVVGIFTTNDALRALVSKLEERHLAEPRPPRV